MFFKEPQMRIYLPLSFYAFRNKLLRVYTLELSFDYMSNVL